MNEALYKKEMRDSWKLLVIFGLILTMYITIIIGMYDPQMMKILEGFQETMPRLMAAVGMNQTGGSLAEFMSSYLYGFIMLVFPMVYSMIRANGLVAKYTDSGALVSLAAAPVGRRKIVFTQMSVLITGIVILILYGTVVEWLVSSSRFPGELEIKTLLMLNGGLLCLHLFIGGICFFFSCLFSDVKYSLAFGAGLPALMFVMKMLADAAKQTQQIRYATFFTLFDANGLIADSFDAKAGSLVLLTAAAVLYAAASEVFCRKDLYI